MAQRTQSGILSSGAATVFFASRYAYVEVENNDGTNALYVTTDGSTPTVGGDDCYLIAPGATVVVANQASYWYQGYGAGDGTQNNPGTTVNIVSASAAAAYSVSGVG
jgi:hypothetical protein